MSNKQPIKILFVCLGNICRSPLAEGVLQQKAAEQGRASEFYIDSAGIGGWHVGQLPDHRMREAAAQRGYQLTSRARQFSPQDFQRFDLIFVMDDENFSDVSAQARTDADRDKIKELASFLPKELARLDIPDPYYGSREDFFSVVQLVEAACDRLLASL